MSTRSLEKRQSEDINEMSSKRKKHHALRMRADNHPDVIRENAALAASRSSTRGRATRRTTTPRAPKE